ncbi:MAG: TetR family transcriptional regulator [Alphaproteobacteria bacterium]|nr:TetR family transcriptional regulator [Alphaproteobacteria bacterium]
MVKQVELIRRVVAKTMELTAIRGWRPLTLAVIAAEAGVPLVEVFDEFSSKEAILSAFTREIDRHVLADFAFDGDGGGSTRERLLRLLTRRFEVLKSYKAALQNIELGGDLPALLSAASRIARSMVLMLEAVGSGGGGLGGAVRANALAAIYAYVVRVRRICQRP